MASRPEITGRKVTSAPVTKAAPPPPAAKATPAKVAKATPEPVTLCAYSIASFCQAHALSEAMYFKMRAMGLGPDEMEYGRRKAISIEAAARWREQREIAARESGKSEEENTEIA